MRETRLDVREAEERRTYAKRSEGIGLPGRRKDARLADERVLDVEEAVRSCSGPSSVSTRPQGSNSGRRRARAVNAPSRRNKSARAMKVPPIGFAR